MKATVIAIQVGASPMEALRGNTFTQQRLLLPEADNLMVWVWENITYVQPLKDEDFAIKGEVEVADSLVADTQALFAARQAIIPLDAKVAQQLPPIVKR